MTDVKVRFAPSPTGNLHVGNLRTALVNHLFARRAGGHFMLRIDDTDTERSTAEFETSIRADLQWMGMSWDSEDRQSARLDRYDAALRQLADAGRAYPCYETPEELALKRKAQLSAGRPPVYDRAALKLSDAQKAEFEAAGRRPHWRFRLNDTDVSWTDMVRGDVSYHMSSLSDPVLMREDGRVIYTMASVVDDIDHGITHIIRGEDHVTNSAAQIQLFEALGATAPAMGHVALLAGADGEGLSKRLGSLSIGQLRDEGMEAAALASLLARIGTADPVVPLAEMRDIVDGFDLSRFGRATAKFDPAELSQVNARIVQQLGFDDVGDRLAGLGVAGGEAFWMAVRDNLSTVAEAAEWWQVCTAPTEPVIEAAAVTDAAADLLPDEVSADIWQGWTKAVAAATGAKGRGLFMPLRLALTGRRKGPEIAPLLAFIGRDRILARLRGETA
ncbi:MAG: glutamate--tRNA ligase [Pseudomonadota bacterium]|nr:glutamate--tRNA ligase [Pseudomonadota bacterium]MEC8673670.1 glutamate--tRNA ligase [Pseudomonadota bacterium]